MPGPRVVASSAGCSGDFDGQSGQVEQVGLLLVAERDAVGHDQDDSGDAVIGEDEVNGATAGPYSMAGNRGRRASVQVANDRIRPREEERFAAVVPAHQVWGSAVRVSDLDDLALTDGMPDPGRLQQNLVAYMRVHRVPLGRDISSGPGSVSGRSRKQGRKSRKPVTCCPFAAAAPALD